MLTISTIPEALAELSKHTGRAWTDSELFDVATTRDIKLHAAPPITAQTTIQEFVIGEGLKEKFRSSPGHAVLAVLFPWQVQQLWIGGETATSHPNEYKVEGEYHFFTEPVKVTREQVRISAQSLGKILNAWNNAQAGLWIVDTAQPSGMRCQNGPNWMFPTDTPAAKVKAGAGATPAPVTQGNKLRRNNLDPAIDKAIKQAGNMELADVYLELKELALAGEKPFTGALDGDALCYTDDNNQPKKHTKNALGKRLKNRR